MLGKLLPTATFTEMMMLLLDLETGLFLLVPDTRILRLSDNYEVSTLLLVLAPPPTAAASLSTAARSRQDSWASPAEKIRPLEKKLGRKPATPKII
jgi:hypothetical protein